MPKPVKKSPKKPPKKAKNETALIAAMAFFPMVCLGVKIMPVTAVAKNIKVVRFSTGPSSREMVFAASGVKIIIKNNIATAIIKNVTFFLRVIE